MPTNKETETQENNKLSTLFLVPIARKSLCSYPKIILCMTCNVPDALFVLR